MNKDQIRFSFFFRVDKANLDLFFESVEEVNQEVMAENQIEDMGESCLVNFYEDVEENGETGIEIYSDGSGDPEEAVRVVQKFMVNADINVTTGFSWSIKFAKPARNGFGGGAVVFDQNSVQQEDTCKFMASVSSRF